MAGAFELSAEGQLIHFMPTLAHKLSAALHTSGRRAALGLGGLSRFMQNRPSNALRANAGFGTDCTNFGKPPLAGRSQALMFVNAASEMVPTGCGALSLAAGSFKVLSLFPVMHRGESHGETGQVRSFVGGQNHGFTPRF